MNRPFLSFSIFLRLRATMAVSFHHFAFEHLPTSVGYGSTGTSSGLTASLSFMFYPGL